MCGIVAVLARPSSRPAPAPGEVADGLARARERLALLATTADPLEQLSLLGQATSTLAALDLALRGVPGLTCLLAAPCAVSALERGTGEIDALIAGYEGALDDGDLTLGTADLEAVNAALVKLRDAIWALGHDRLDALKSVLSLVESLGIGAEGSAPSPAALGVLWAAHVAFRALDRLEVRGRDSAGLHLMLAGHGLDFSAPGDKALLVSRTDPLFTSLGARAAEGCLSIVYKVAAAIGELGDNVAVLRQALGTDPLLARALASPDVTATVVAHTRWASVGLISQANAHPLNSEESGTAPAGPYVIGALNGDIDNYAQLMASEGVSVPPEVTTDAKLIPTLVSRYLGAGAGPTEAFLGAVGCFEGSVGIAANASCAPSELLLALRGSGQSLNIGLAEDAFVVASEPYGLVEETSQYLRMDGEGDGQVVVCRRDGAGALAGLSRWRYQGTELLILPTEVKVAEITTRDVDRRGFRHFFLKEISESPVSVRKTLRGKLVNGENGRLVAHLGDDVIPPSIRQALSSGRIRNILVIGQGTAAVAGQAVAGAISRALPGISVKPMPASELSGWGPSGTGLPDDMNGDLVVAISQSGTTTDTNRTVDLVRARGAYVVCIVNRRNSDLVQKSHGVLYTSDGRDVEMAVASTKAFYSQVTAGHLLAAGLAGAAGVPATAATDDVLAALRDLPSLMEKVLARRPEISKVAAALAPARRYWAVVGSGPDRVAAAEVRIKLSELCYKAIGLDAIEDKKHIDLSAEPLIIVCAASISGPNAHDIAKEIEIFRAHKAAPVVIVPEGLEYLFSPGVEVLSVPVCHSDLAFVLGAMVGHIFGYEAALSIDGQAQPFRAARALLEGASEVGTATSGVGGPDGSLALDRLAPALEAATAPALAGLRAGAYDGHLNASTAARLTSLLRYATGALPVEGYEAEMGKVGTPGAIATDLIDSLGTAIDELTRPVDAIKHQAKTVTVGISRSEEALIRAELVVAALAAGASLEAFGYRALRTLAALGPGVTEVLGYTRYQIEPGPDPAGAAALTGATISVVDRGGIAAGMVSRTSSDGTLRGTKHRTADKREVTVFNGLHDGRTGVMIPEVKDGQVTGITLLHARFADRLEPEVARSVLEAYQGRYTALVDAVTEARPQFDDEVLGAVGLVELLTEPVAVLAGHWSTPPGGP
jgi:glucosamine--fructose-6-phosphate aminotransferase (isomerizing)